MNGKKAAALLLLFTLFAAFSLFKVRLFSLSPGFDRADGTAFFWSESAFQYRYAKMVSEGLPVPEIDEAAQFPEGARPREEFTLGMELLSGGLYRLLFGGGQGPPFHVYLTWFISFYTSLTLLAVYGLGLALGGGRAGGLLAAFFYVSARISWARAVNGFNYEDFALPLLFGGLAFFIGAMKEEGHRRTVYSVLSALLTAAALAGWHFSRFYLLVFAAAAAAVLLTRRDGDRALAPLAGALAASVIAALSVPVLRAGGLLLSPPLILLAALAAALYAGRAFGLPPGRRAVVFLGAAALLAASAALLPGADAREYSHVYSLFAEKVRFLLAKPADPLLLPFEARVLWVEALETPGLHDWFTWLSVLLPLGLPPFLYEAWRLRGGAPAHRFLFFALTAAFLLASFFAVRMFLFGAFFLAVCSAAWPEMLKRTAAALGRKKTAALAAACLALALASDLLAYGLKPRPGSPPTFYRGDVKTLVEWARANTGKDEPFLGNLGASAALLAYADRPTVINPKFETRRLRDKFERFARALFESERELHALCLEYGASYFIHENHFVLDGSKKSFRYLAGNLRLPADSAAYRMQFDPGSLNLFAPAHQTSTFRVYKVVRPGEKAAAAHPFPYDPIYDPRVFGAEPGDEFFDDSRVMPAALRILIERETGRKGRAERPADRQIALELRERPAAV
ncbi:MAG: hypothetical protein FD189_1392 [Elusimicrobia bacterium]|nr:MAG: hypothetical protein FD154_1411 [Elusimicrobiota bacterium]KAF0155476.1 MAG: hypothetical protein FD189_1392 [Elusimicrobiota bacterium]